MGHEIMPLRLELEKAKFQPGEVIRGQLHIELAKPTRARKVEITLKGREYAMVTRLSREDEQSIFKENKELVNASITPWTPTGEESLGPCELSFPFQFQLPLKCPPAVVPPLRYTMPSYADEAKIRKTIPSYFTGGIIYEIHAKIDKQRAIDPKAKCNIVVDPTPIDPPPTKAVTSTYNEVSKGLWVELQVDQNRIKPGDRLTGVVKYKQGPDLKIRAVEITSQFSLHINAGGYTDRYTQIMDRVTFSIERETESYTWPFDLATFADGPFSVNGLIVQIKWGVSVKVDVPLGKDKHVEVPIEALPLKS